MNFIKENISHLKREYGFPVVLCNIVSTALDLDTGEKRRTLQIRYVPRAVLLPVKQYYKEGYNPNDRSLLVDYCDFNIKVGTQVIYGNQQYDVIEANIFEQSAAYVLKIRALEGVILINPGLASDTIILSDSAVGDKGLYLGIHNNIVLNEEAISKKLILPSLTDALTINQELIQAWGLSKGLTDTLILTDNSIRYLISSPSLTDALTINQNSVKQKISSPSKTDTLTLVSASTYDLIPGLGSQLTAAWHLNEESGVRTDAVGSLDLTDNNTVGFIAGKVGNATSHNQANDEYLSHADHADLQIGDNDWQLTGWVRITNIGITSYIISKYGATAVSEYALRHNANDKFLFYTRAPGGGLTICTATTFGVVPVNTWCFVSIRHDSVNDKTGISVNNGAWDEMAFNTGVRITALEFRIGAPYAAPPGARFTGNIDAVHIWKGMLLSADELTYMYNAGNGRELP